MKERIHFIDRLKGFAIIAVVFGHVIFFSLESSDVVLGNLVASFHMPIFMFLLAALCSTLFLVCVFRQRESSYGFAENQLAYIGRNSLDIYLYHFFLVHFLFLGDLGIWLRGTNNYMIEFLIAFLIAIFVSYASILVGMILRKSEFLDKVVYGHFIKTTEC